MSHPPPLPKRRFGPAVYVVLGLGLLALVLIGLAVAWRLRLQHRVDAEIARIKAAGLPTSGTELNDWYRAVPDSQNAARVMAGAFGLWQSYSDDRSNRIAKFKLPARGAALSTGDRELLAGYVALNTAALAKAHEALALTNSRFPIDYSAGMSTLLPHLSQIKRLLQLAGYDAYLASDEGRKADAIQAMETTLACAQTLETEPDLIGQLVRIAALVFGVNALEHGLGVRQFNGEELARLAIDFSAAEKTNLMARALVADRAMNLPHFRMSYAEIKRLTAPSDDESEVLPGGPLPGRRQGFIRVTGYFERDLSFYLEAMQTNITLASEPPPRSLAATKANERQSTEARKKLCILSALLLPALSNCVAKEESGIARLHLAQGALAIERFHLAEGRLPADLKELVPRFLPAVPMDPFDGAPLRYRPLPKGYVLYSVDRDGQDDGGREPPVNKKSTDKTSYDLTFTVAR